MELLMIDTDRDFVEMLTGWLTALGYAVHRAYTGEQAMREWVAHQPELIILDTALKDVDALAMCRQMRSKHDAPVLIVTDGKDVHQVRGNRIPYLGFDRRWGYTFDQSPYLPYPSESGTGSGTSSLSPHRSRGGLYTGIPACGWAGTRRGGTNWQ
jgi:CheY-like chemotaxis protein